MCRTLMVMAPLSLEDLVSLLSASALFPPLLPPFLEVDLSDLVLLLVSPLAGLVSLDLAILGGWLFVCERVGLSDGCESS